jgi:rhamnosyltransferase
MWWRKLRGMNIAFNKVIAVIVTYNSGEELRENLPMLLPQVSKIILVDNSTEHSTVELLKKIDEQFENIEVIINGANLGLGAAQNIGIRRAVEQGADWVLLLDDDSKPDEVMVGELQKVLAEHPEPSRVGLLAARIVDVSSGKRYPCLKMYSRWKVSRVNMDEHPMMDGALLAMASGSLIRVETLRQTGLMREDFIIDFIDWEFCWRLIRGGWSIVQVRDAVLHHRLGAQTNHRKLGRNWVTTNYPPFRRFTTARNRILFWRIFRFRLPPGLFAYQCMSMVYEGLVILLCEQGKAGKLAAILRGTSAGLLRRGLAAEAPRL